MGPGDDFDALLDPPDTLEVLKEEVRQVPALRPGEQDALLLRLKAGDARARERLLETHLHVVLTSATVRRDRGLPVGDLFQEGSIGLFTAIGDFTGDGSTEFERFIEEQVDLCLDTALQAEELDVQAERALVVAAEDFDRVELMLARELKRKPTDLEIGARLEWDAARTAHVREMVDEARRRHDAEILALLEPEELDLLEPIDVEEGEAHNRDGSLN